MKILVTGSEGYLGSVLGPQLARAGHEVIGLDTGYYVSGELYAPEAGAAPAIFKDLRNITAADLVGFDAVVHLAELSNDPTGAMRPSVTFEINHQASVRLARLAKQAGATRFVYMSSCSVYGASADQIVDERAAVDPQTAYAECKVLVEADLHALADDDFSPTILRNGTAFGASPRMRFDLVVNNLAGLAHTAGRVAMTSDGTPWRPLVHVLDIVQAIECTLAAPRDTVHDAVFNVGSNDQNYRVLDIAAIVAEVFPHAAVTLGTSGSDNRSYRVNFDRIHTGLPGFACRWDARRGTEQLQRLFDEVALSAEMFATPAFTRLRMLEWLISAGRLDESFYWSTEEQAA